MKPKPMFLNELTSSSNNYKVRVRVIEKNRPQLGQLKKLPYQGLLLCDDQGNKMRGALFGSQIHNFRDALVSNGAYEIANAPIKPMDDKWKKSPKEVNYQMFFDRDTVIQSLESEAVHLEPDYKSIGQVPRAGDPADKFDVLGIVLYVDEKPREANVGPKRKIGVTEIVLMDHSTQQPLSISAWDDLAATASGTLAAKTKGFDVVALTALKVSRHKGFSMATTMSSDIILEPNSPKVVALQKWSDSNLDKLTELKARLVQAKAAASQKLVITIADLHAKRAQHTLLDERYWLKVTVPSAELEKLHAYLGCSKCSRRSEMPAETIYTCPLCRKEDCISTPRVTFGCEVTDGTGNLSITAFTNHAEKMFRLTAHDLFRIKHSEDLHAFAAAQILLHDKPSLIEVGPNNTLSISNILEWSLKQVVTEADEASDSAGLPQSSGPENKKNAEPLSPNIGGPEHLKTPEKMESRIQRGNTPTAAMVHSDFTDNKGITTVPTGTSNDTQTENEVEPRTPATESQGEADARPGFSGDTAGETA